MSFTIRKHVQNSSKWVNVNVSMQLLCLNGRRIPSSTNTDIASISRSVAAVPIRPLSEAVSTLHHIVHRAAGPGGTGRLWIGAARCGSELCLTNAMYKHRVKWMFRQTIRSRRRFSLQLNKHVACFSVCSRPIPSRSQLSL